MRVDERDRNDVRLGDPSVGPYLHDPAPLAHQLEAEAKLAGHHQAIRSDHHRNETIVAASKKPQANLRLQITDYRPQITDPPTRLPEAVRTKAISRACPQRAC